MTPSGWEVVLLDSVAKRGSGHTPDKKHPEYWSGSIKWVSLKDSDRLDKLYIFETAESITQAGIANSSAVEHPKGTVVLSRDAGVGKSAITQDVMAVSQHFMAWRCGPRLDNHFLYYWLQATKPEFERVAVGNTIKTIGLPYFQALTIPLPPLPEQRAVAAALSDVDALIASLDRLIAKKRDLKQGVMQLLLTGQTRLPGFSGKWRRSTVGAEFEIKLGKMLDAEKNVGSLKPYIGNKSVQWGRVDTDDLKLVAMSVADQERYRLRAGDLLVCEGGEVGRAAIWDAPIGECYYQKALHRLRPVRDFDARFMLALLKYWSDNDALSDYVTQTSIAHLTREKFASVPLPVPLLAEQSAIAAVLSDMDAELTALEQRRDKTRLLKQGMMQELLTGRTRLV